MINTKQSVHRGRPRKFDPQDGIIIAAKLFREKGFDAVGVAELTKAMGIKAPSFYAAYGSKRQLLCRALQHYQQSDGGFAEPICDETLSLKEFVAKLFDTAAKAYSEQGKPHGCLVMECTRNTVDKAAELESAELRNVFRQKLKDRLAGDAPERADALANYAMMVLTGLSASAKNGMSRKDLTEMAQIAAKAII